MGESADRFLCRHLCLDVWTRRVETVAVSCIHHRNISSASMWLFRSERSGVSGLCVNRLLPLIVSGTSGGHRSALSMCEGRQLIVVQVLPGAI